VSLIVILSKGTTGYKMFMAVDQNSGITRRMNTMTANTNDTVVTHDMVTCVCGQGFYVKRSKRKHLRSMGCLPELCIDLISVNLDPLE
jgi:hypothetical protein